MNRHDRRRSRKVGSMAYVKTGFCVLEGDNTEIYTCYSCDADAAPWFHNGMTVYGCGRINNNSEYLPLCRTCFETGNTIGMARKFFGNPNITFEEGGETPPDLREICDALDESEKATHQ
jgi:hypothetical protein